MRADSEESLAALLRRAGRRVGTPEGAEARVKEAVRVRWDARVAKRRLRRLLIGLAAAAVLLAGIGYILRGPEPLTVGTVTAVQGSARGPSGTLSTNASVSTGDVLTTSASGRLSVSLRSGTSVRLDHGSRLELRSENDAILHRGRVYIDAGPSGKAAPLRIETPYGVVEHVGTQYLVDLGAESLSLRVREGAVSIRQSDGGRHVIESGRMASASRGKNWQIHEDQGFGPSWDWVSEVAPPFSPRNGELLEVLRWVCRERGWTLRYESASLEQTVSKVRVAGSLRGLSPVEALGVVLPAAALGYNLANGVVLVQNADSTP